MAIQITTDTELSAVNSILGSIGQSPITALNLAALNNPEVALVHNLLMEANKDIQAESWHFNTEHGVEINRDANGEYLVPNNYIQFDIADGQIDRNRDVIRKDGKLWDIVHQTHVFDQNFKFDIVYLRQFEDVPPSFQRYIISRASVRAATQLVSNPELVKLLSEQEARARATALDYDCAIGDHSFMGWPHESSYRAYQPYKALIR